MSARRSLARRILNSLRLRFRHVSGTVDLTPDGFVLTQAKTSETALWTDITQIDAGVIDALASDRFYTVLHRTGHRFVIDEFTDGFQQLEFAIFERWPQIRKRWVAVYTGAPSEPRYEVLWRRGL